MLTNMIPVAKVILRRVLRRAFMAEPESVVRTKKLTANMAFLLDKVFEGYFLAANTKYRFNKTRLTALLDFKCRTAVGVNPVFNILDMTIRFGLTLLRVLKRISNAQRFLKGPFT